jgi:hypothetical protein
MASITTRQLTGTGVTVSPTPLSNAQIDQNFINLNDELAQKLPLTGGTLTGGLTVGGNLTVNGTTVTVNSTTVTVDDPIFTIGGDTAPTVDDNKDRGIEFRWHNGTTGKLGFFGLDDSTGKFTFIPDATNTSEVFGGTKGTIDANLEWADVLSKPTTLSGYGITDAVPISGGTFTGAVTVPAAFTVNAQGGEGGEIVLKKGTGQTSLSGDVHLDTLGTSFRIFENGGAYRQITFDLTNGNITGANGIVANINGNAATSTSWQTARTITIGSTGKSVDGSAAVSWTLAEIGAYAATNPSGYITSSASITGSAGSLSTNTSYLVDRGTVAQASVDTATSNGFYLQSNAGDSDGLLVFNPGGSLGAFQLHAKYTGLLRFRNRTDNTTWTSWKTILHDGNYNSYALPLTGGTLTGSRSITLDTSGGDIEIRGDSGGWGTGLYFVGSSGTNRGGYGALGSADSLTNLWIGPSFSSPWMTLSSSAVNSSVALQQSGNQVLHAGNVSTYALPIGGGTVTGGLNAPYIGVNNTTNTNGYGISLYNGAVAGEPTYGIMFQGTATFGNHGAVSNASDWATYFTMNNDNGRGWIFRKAGTGNTSSISAGGVAQFDISVRSPIFYDSNDTSFYLDPNATTSLKIAGNIEQGSNLGRPNIEWNASGSSTGMVIFSLPGAASTNYGMVHMVFDYYEYVTGRTATVIIGGHNWSTSWYENGCTVIGNLPKEVRLGVKDGKYCVVFGVAGSTWSYGTIRLRKIHNAGFYDNVLDVGGSYSVVQTTTESFTNVTGDLRQFYTPKDAYAYAYRGHSNVAGTGEASFHPAGVYSTGTNWLYGSIITNNNTINSGTGSISGSIFYDSNDTSYYVDPNSNSRLVNLGLGGVTPDVRLSISGAAHVSDYLYMGGTAGSSGSWSGRMISSGGNTAIHTNTFEVSRTGYGSGSFTMDTDGNSFASASFRAPIFYDSNNTAYYTDPASTSVLNALQTAGQVVIGGTFSTTAHSNFTAARLMFSGGDADAQGNYYIGTNAENYGGNHNKLDLRWHTGIRMGAQPGYGGIRFYDTEDLGTQIFAIGKDGSYAQANQSMRAPIFYDLDNTGYYIDPTSSSRLSAIYCGDVYNDLGGWFRSYNNTGIYNQTYGNHFYATSDAYWNIAANNGSISGLIFRTGGHQGTVRGYVYSDSSNNIGFLNSGGNWRGRVVGDDYWLAETSSRSPIFYDSNDSGYYWDGASTSKWNESNQNGWHTFNNYGLGVTGTYASTRLQTVFAMGSSYRMAADGTDTSNMYGIAWSHPNAGTLGGANNLNDHGILIINNGGFRAAISSRAVFSSDVRGTLFYDYNDTGYYCDPNSSSYLHTLLLSGANYFRPQNWIQFDGSYGVYWPNHYGAHLHANDLSTYTQIALRGGKNSYGGIYDQYSAVNIGMFDSSGNGGVYREANGRWFTYYHVGNDCLGIGSSSTNSSYGIYCGKGLYAGGRVDGTIFYDANDTGYYCDPNSTSRLLTLNVVGDITVGVGQNSSNIYMSDADEGQRRIHCNSNRIGFLNDSNNWGSYCGDGGEWYSDQSVRSPLFYDNNDTDGVIDPVGHSRLKYTGSASSGNESALEIKNNGGTGDGNVAAISWHCTGQYGLQMHLRHDGYFGIGGWSASTWRWYVDNTNGNMTAAGNVTAYSDPRLKEEVTLISCPIEKIKQLNGVHFRWKDISELGKPGSYDYGILATDVEKIAPELVCESAITSPDGDRYKTVAYDKLTPFLIEAVKEQQKIIDAQELRLQALEKLLGVNP